MRIIFIFIDGLGVGENETTRNPCTAPGLTLFNRFVGDLPAQALPKNGLHLPLDATLDTPGLPQSASGQTALLTGVNAARVLGRHLNGFPNAKLRSIIAKSSLLGRLTNAGFKVAFLNAFRPPFFDYKPEQLIRYLSVTSVANLYAGLPFFNLDDLRRKRCIYQEFTNEHLRRVGFDVPHFTPEQAGEILAAQAVHYDFCLFEYFQTDKAGHSMNLRAAKDELYKLERFLLTVLDSIDLSDTILLVTSDHGNMEDISVKGHTRNPVMTMLWGAHRTEIAATLGSILDIAPALYEYLARSFGNTKKRSGENFT